ncbi:hypothetical protein Tco_1084705 [Tanacetum coccineum]
MPSCYKTASAHPRPDTYSRPQDCPTAAPFASGTPGRNQTDLCFAPTSYSLGYRYTLKRNHPAPRKHRKPITHNAGHTPLLPAPPGIRCQRYAPHATQPTTPPKSEHPAAHTLAQSRSPGQASQRERAGITHTPPDPPHAAPPPTAPPPPPPAPTADPRCPEDPTQKMTAPREALRLIPSLLQKLAKDRKLAPPHPAADPPTALPPLAPDRTEPQASPPPPFPPEACLIVIPIPAAPYPPLCPHPSTAATLPPPLPGAPNAQASAPYKLHPARSPPPSRCPPTPATEAALL